MKANLIRVLIFYMLYILSCILVELVLPSGPHGPGLSFFIFILFGCVSVLMLLFDLGKIINGNKEYKSNLLVHLTFYSLIVFLICYLKS